MRKNPNRAGGVMEYRSTGVLEYCKKKITLTHYSATPTLQLKNFSGKKRQRRRPISSSTQRLSARPYLPVNRGLRFSMKAVMASIKSSEGMMLELMEAT